MTPFGEILGRWSDTGVLYLPGHVCVTGCNLSQISLTGGNWIRAGQCLGNYQGKPHVLQEMVLHGKQRMLLALSVLKKCTSMVLAAALLEALSSGFDQSTCLLVIH